MKIVKAFIVVLTVLLLFGCQQDAQKVPVEEPQEEIPVVEVEEPVSEEPIVVEETEIEAEEEVEEEPVEEVYEGPTHILTGLPDLNPDENYRPIVVMIDNHVGARPQAGLAKADIVYEILAEGSITRYMAIFQSELPNHVGPVRSARPYFISKALEFDPLYVHVGGSMQAMTDIKQLNMADVDGLSSSATTFWRESHKKIPHNMYSSAEEIMKWANRKGYRTNYNVEFAEFNKGFVIPEGEEALQMAFTYKPPTSSDTVGYTSSYNYNEGDQVYVRSVNGSVHIDEDSKEEIVCTNVIVQYASTRVIDNEGRREITLTGSGDGKYYTGGVVIDITWEKYDRRAETKFYDVNGNEITLNPGKTWIQVVPKGFEIK